MLLHVDDYGPGPVVVLLHGFPLDHAMWHHQRDEVGALYRVIAPDLRGQGKTPAPEGPYSIDEMADDVIETLDALQLEEPVAIGGLSMGGYVALSIAARYPGRLKGLMFLNTRAGADSPEAAKGREALRRKMEEAGSVEPVVEAMFGRLFSEATRRDHPEEIARLHRRASHGSMLGIAGAMQALATRPDRTADLAGIDTPTLVVAGLEDVFVPIDEARSMAAAIPGTRRLVEVADAGHLAPLEKPKVVNAAILEFLEGLG